MSYEQLAKEKQEALIHSGHATVLAIETSCDETACAIVRDGREVLSNVVHTQIPLHRKYGGVVPELASRNHVERIGAVVEKALQDAAMMLDDVDAVAVTCGPGLVGALLVGVSYAKGLALSHNLPLVGTNHILGHIAANYLTFSDLEPPFTCLIASGGHSHIVRVEDYDRCTLIGRTRDDAAGEAFDKVARVLGLPYPGGPELEKLAKDGDPKAIRFRSAFNEREDEYDMSFSGLKTAVINVLHTAEQRGEDVNRADVAASFQYEVISILSDKAVRAASDTLALAGGVSANAALRDMLARKAKKKGIRFCCPDFRYCTDNAAMIGSAGFYLLMKGHRDGLDLNATPYLSVV
ncbi:MAG: tRNA (adenosine(37)-N6)-threonylcarbamoyltransferase complex transferase subunit TsaD [Clostridia bacterium]|nr:tRNA (adenosine(37)-N6)-threonylcarbamoyltransferase complex transferase subunit TsaD [Clostridia bacterium]MBQ6236024.1 tRNA (adenosine(37)-N6)-threonylcarbamoyltransferase complex transferase subunit TsaD [Clostridia bacterium]MBR0436149.1 tRNA (adenosine(37)-N6)-threonylcarbamoyltransferase complex transferase subunit TsaD [Clostridia bacterium]